jgi:hypothetical protein
VNLSFEFRKPQSCKVVFVKVFYESDIIKIPSTYPKCHIVLCSLECILFGYAEEIFRIRKLK